jgi:hypothetical protein
MARERTDQQSGRLRGAAGDRERRPGLRAAGAAAARAIGPIVARGGGGVLARLKAEWIAVAGAEFAAVAWPEAIARDGALKLRVEPGAALELQHRAPLLIERINRFFGRTAVARLVLIQGRPPLAPLRAPPPDALSAAEAKSLEVQLAEIADSDLREALAGLGHLVLGRSRD